MYVYERNNSYISRSMFYNKWSFNKLIFRKGKNMGIRTGMSKEEVTQNLLEVALYLVQNEDANMIDIKIKNLNIHFEAWTDEEE